MKIILLDTNKLPAQMVTMIEELFSKFGEYKSYEITTLNNIVNHAYEAEVILTNKAELRDAHFKLLPNLKYIIVIATGYDCVDVKSAKAHNIRVSNIPGYASEIVAQHTIALLLELTNHVGKTSDSVMKEHKWLGAGKNLIELSGLTIGVIGFGNIAKKVITIAIAFGMNVLVHRKTANYNTDLNIKFVDKDELLRKSDVVSLHCAYNEETKYIINYDSLALMKPSAYLINTSRGGLVNEAALYEILLNKKIAGAGLDVLETEPSNSENSLFKLDNCIITPHNAWLSDNSLKRWIGIMQDNIISYKEGKLINRV